jgi:DNA-binding transcriptional MerR regulator
MLAIGDFSRITHLSIRTLRHYHEVGLLEPAEVDPSSGYRHYTLDQVPTAQVIRRFRDLDMPVERVREVLAAPDLATRNKDPDCPPPGQCTNGAMCSAHHLDPNDPDHGPHQAWEWRDYRCQSGR